MAKIWLYGAVTFVIALVVGGIAVALVTGRGGTELLPSDSPEGAVQRYLLAMKDEEYREAYDYLSSDLQRECSYDYFLKGASYTEIGEGQVTLESVRTVDGRTQVKVRITVFEPGGPLGASEYSYDWTFHLKLEEGQWRLVSMPEMPWPVPCPPY
ncbi:MAG: hypothetical protein Q8P22_14475 [Chloroflexota bacterium]|nr:hypothetical protein [Chloroflexota bacterium]